MSSQELDLRRSWGIIRRYRWVVAGYAAIGLLGGLLCGFLFPALPNGEALVVLPPPIVSDGQTSNQDIETQVLIANSAPVLSSAGQNLRPPLPTPVVKDRVRVDAVTEEILRIRAKGLTPRQAVDLANAVAETYVFYVTDAGSKLPGDLGKKTGARVLERATTATGGNTPLHLAVFALLGAVVMVLAGSLVVLVAARGDRRLRLRDDIADAVGIPVLASVAARRPSGAAGWEELLGRYKPSAVDAWNLRKTLHHLGLDSKGGEQVSLTVVSLADDVGALSVGPQLVTFATSIGISAELVVDSRHEAAVALVAATTQRSGGSPAERTDGGSDATSHAAPHGAVALVVYVVVVDRAEPRFAGTRRADETVMAVSAGRVTAEEMARVAVAAANEGREVEGILVTDPDPSDRTTGRGPHAPGGTAPGPRRTITDSARGVGR